MENEHGISRRQQNLTNNLKSNSGIERIPFNGINELDTEQGPNGETVHALNTGDSRIRFVGDGWTTEVSSSGTAIRGSLQNDFVEITFFGTNINLLSTLDGSANVRLTVDGGTEGTTNIIEPSSASTVLNGQNVTPNTVVPLLSTPLSAGIHTIKLRLNNAGSSTFWRMSGCEVINENAAITQQSGADFDGRVELLTSAARDWPIKPTNTTITARNDASGVDIAFSGTVGARVLNYLTSGGQQKQVYEPAVENLQGPVGNVHTLTFNAGTTSTVTIPASYNVSNLSVLAFGAGGSGGGGAFIQASFLGSNSQFGTQSGGGGAGGGRAFSNFTNSAPGSDLALTVVVPGAGNTAAGSFQLIGGDSGTAAATDGNDGGNATVSVGGTQIIGATGGEGGEGGNVFASAGTGGVNSGTTDFNGGAGGTTVGIGQAITDDTMAISGTTLTPRNAQNSGTDQMIADNAKIGGDGGTSTDTNTNIGGGAGGNGARPGADHDGGAGGSASNGGVGTGTAGEAGSLVLIFSSATGTALTGANFTDAVVPDGLPEGAALSTFGNDAFNASRARQEVIRRINVREFGANNQFATASNAISAFFTLDDGTTTLTAERSGTTNAGDLPFGTGFGKSFISFNRTGSTDGRKSLVITFVGTGLDTEWIYTGDTSAVYGDIDVTIDGLSIGNLTPIAANAATITAVVRPIVSGLSYGTHTISFTSPNNSSGFDNGFGIADFILYGPKKPEIPTLDDGALELSDYNIMADYVARTSPSTLFLSKGTLAKTPDREITYTGSGSRTPSDGFSDDPFGVVVGVTGANDTVSYTFYGTGINVQARTNNVTFANTVQVDGVALGSRFSTTTLTEGGGNYVTGTSTWNGGAGAHNDIILITGMPLGVHTIEFTRTAGQFLIEGMWIETPIHINKDTLKIGSEGLNNLTIDPVVEEDEAVVLANLGDAKAWIDCMPTGSPRATHNIAAVIKRGTGQFTIYFDKPFKSGDYVVIGTSSSSARTFAIEGVGNKRANSVDIVITRNDGANLDESFWAAFFGELIDE